MEEYIKMLSGMPLFAGIASENISQVLTRLGAYIRSFRKDEYIRLTGDPADFIGLVLEGQVRILQDDCCGKRSIIANIEPGSLFAEVFACAGVEALPVDILALADTRVLFISRSSILGSCDSSCAFHERLTANLLRIVARKNLLLSQKLQYLSRKTTADKLLAYLADQSRINGSSEFDIALDRQGLADYLGVERSAMSAEISKLVQQGYIETRKSHFRLLRLPE